MIAARDCCETSTVRPSSLLDQPSSEGPSEVLSRLGMDQNVTCTPSRDTAPPIGGRCTARASRRRMASTGVWQSPEAGLCHTHLKQAVRRRDTDDITPLVTLHSKMNIL